MIPRELPVTQQVTAVLTRPAELPGALVCIPKELGRGHHGLEICFLKP